MSFLDPKTVQVKDHHGSAQTEDGQSILDDDASFTDEFMPAEKVMPGQSSPLFQNPRGTTTTATAMTTASEQQQQQAFQQAPPMQPYQQSQSRMQVQPQVTAIGRPVEVQGRSGQEEFPQQFQEHVADVQQQQQEQQQQQYQQQPSLPTGNSNVIYTFWGPVTPMKNNGQKGTGMTVEADEAMMELWKAHWRGIGWEPRILTIEDAQRHPRYEEFQQKLELVPLWGKKRAGVNREYNMHCYTRWLAMAVVGGGWMSDYDVLPIRPIHHPIGKFTAYSAGLEGKGVPCLLSGTALEWERLAFAILHNGLAHKEAELWSDMMAFMDVKENGAPYDTNKTVVEAGPLMTGKPWTDYECQLLERFEAIHFSHYSIVEGVVREGETFKHRPQIAINIMKLYHERCQPTTIAAVSLQANEARTPQLQHVPEGVAVVPMNHKQKPQS